MEKRMATLSVFVEEKDSVVSVNKILSDYSDIIISRMGTPYKEREIAVIVLILDGTNDEIGAMSGRLGNLNGVSAKSAMPKLKK